MTVLNKILNTSERLFTTYGLKSISMDDIATDIGISKKTIYKHFCTKDKLINITLSHFLKKEIRIIDKINIESENAVEEIITIGRHILKMTGKLKPTLIFDLKKYHPRNWDLVEKHHHEYIHDVIKKNIKRGISEGNFRKSLNPDIIAKLYVAKSLVISDESNFKGHDLDFNTLLKEHLLYHLYGVLSETGVKLVTKYELETI